jgi:transcription antitermination factor NusG
VTDDPQWYAVRVVVQREYVVAEMLRRQGLSTFIPTEVRAHKRSSYSKGQADFAVPILPGMVFVGFPSAPAWYDVLERNQLIVAPFSLGTEGTPTRLRMDRLLEFFSGVSDGCMVRDKEGLRLIHMPGRSPVRALDTRVKTISARRKAEKSKPARAKRDDPVPTVPAPRKYADFLSRYVHGGTA